MDTKSEREDRGGVGTLEDNTADYKDLSFHSGGDGLPVTCKEKSSITRLNSARLDCRRQGYEKVCYKNTGEEYY